MSAQRRIKKEGDRSSEKRARAVGYHTQPRREPSERGVRTSQRVIREQGEGPRDHQGGRRVAGVHVLILLGKVWVGATIIRSHCSEKRVWPVRVSLAEHGVSVYLFFVRVGCVAGVVQPCQECSAACERGDQRAKWCCRCRGLFRKKSRSLKVQRSGPGLKISPENWEKLQI